MLGGGGGVQNMLGGGGGCTNEVGGCAPPRKSASASVLTNCLDNSKLTDNFVF